jgi:hypothetical protein
MLATGLPLTGQSKSAIPGSGKKQGPRAIAVVRWQPDAKGNAVPILIPVAIVVEGKIYDAGLYRLSPRPFALEPGTLYEAQDKGELLGFFTVETPTRNQHGAPWVGLGKWKDDAPGLEFDPRLAKESVRQAKPADVTVPVADDGTPSNKKTKTVYDESGKPIDHPEDDKDEPERDKHGNQKPLDRSPTVVKDKPKADPQPKSPDEDPDRPKIKRSPGGTQQTQAGQAPGGAQPEQPKADPAPTQGDDDPDRPKIKRGVPPSSQAQTKTVAATPPADTDPNRPILKRSTGEQKKDKVGTDL